MLRIALSILLIAGLSATGLGLTGCGDDDGTDTESDAGGTADDAGGADAGSTDGAAGDATGSLDCDYQTVAGIAVIEAEALPITEEWSTGKDADASGGQYIQWTGQSRNNNTEFGRFEITVAVAAPGLYKLQWYNRIGMGDNATEHNDTWVQFPDVAEFYAIQGPADAEDRVYPRPRCEDAEFLATVEALPTVTEASCPEGSSRDGYFKVYSSGALDWKWSARTSDSDAHDVVVRIDAAGTYTMQLAARADFHQIDRIVLHDITLPNDQVRDLGLATTPCP